MSLADLNFKLSYNTHQCNVVQEFLIPALKQAVEYDRAVGFFSSTSLMAISVGIKDLVENGGKIRLICSPRLSKEDIEAIQDGYDRRSVIENALEREFVEPENVYQEERLNILSHLIADGILDIKVANMKTENPNAMFHVKIGVIYDVNANYVAFTGSMNDSENAFFENEDTIEVFSSLGHDYDRAFDKKEYFNEIWENQRSNLEVISFPEAIVNRINTYRKDYINWNVDNDEMQGKGLKKQKTIPDVPPYISIRDYQQQAYQNWKAKSYCGIYDMATGTGKTYTALYSIVELLKEKNQKVSVVICCPYQHLVNQWSEDLDAFGFMYIMGFSSSRQKDWKKRLEKSVFNVNHRIKDNFIFITTNATFSSLFVQNQLKNVNRELLIVIDEAHNFGTDRLVSMLDEKYDYRLALSATLERHNDLVGTKRLYDFFGERCIEYSLERAIQEGKLCQYYYYPIPVYLEDYELEEYNELSKELVKYIKKNKDGEIEYTKQAERILIKRARLIAGANQKLAKVREVASQFINDNHLLVYCGSTTVVDTDYKEGKANNDEIRQVEAVSKILGEIGIRSSRFTSEETAEERERLKAEFAKGDVIQALVAIRCLDEGVNIPDIDKAIIMASSTNPKEYIQRRGRVLRTAKGKRFARIYDFVTLPHDLDEITPTTDTDYDLGLIKREIIRVKDFARLSLNEYESDDLISKIEDVYGLLEERIEFEEDGDKM